MVPRMQVAHDALLGNLGALNYIMRNPSEAAFSNKEGLRKQNEEHRAFIKHKSKGWKPAVAPSSEETLNPKPQTLNPESQTPNPKP